MATLNTLQVSLLNNLYKYVPALRLWTTQGGSLLGDVINSLSTAVSTDMLNVYIHESAVGGIVVCESAAYGFTIDSVIGTTGTGTVTATVQINGVTVTGLGTQSWTTVQSTKTATALKTVSVGDRVVINIDGASVFTKFGCTFRITKT